MSIPGVLRDFFKYPGMYIRRVDFDTATAFIQGFDIARDGEILAGFREWLVMKLGFGNNLAWPGLVLRLAYPAPAVPPLNLPDADQTRLVGLLSGVLEEFWKEREAAGGAGELMRRHADWLRTQDWYQEVPAGRER